MSKDMINIDDFVRNKLNGHSEKEDPAAWLKMKDLLDKEMPEKAAPFLFRFSKPVAMLGAALLVGALCVGGYQLSALRDIDSDKANTITNATSNNNKGNSYNTAPATIIVENKSTAENPITAENTNQKDNDNTAVENNITNNKNSVATSNTDNKNTATAAQKNNTKEANTSSKIAENSKSNTIANATKTIDAKSNKNIAPQQNKNNTAQPNIASNTKKEATKAAEKPAQKKQNTDQASKNKTAISKLSFAATKSAATTNPKSKVTAIAIANDLKKENKKTANSDSNPIANKKTNNTDNALPTDSMPAITVVSKTTLSKTFPKKTINKLDTTAIGKVPIAATEAEEKAIAETAKNTAKANTAKNKAAQRPENQLAAKGPTQNNTEPITLAKSDKKKKPANNWFSNVNIPEAVADAKKDIRNATFNFGFEGGLNYSPSKNNSFQGVQFGPTGHLVFNKRWSLFGAVKYFNRSGSKKTVNDNYATQYTTGLDSTRGANNYFTVRTDSTNRYFNFSTLHSFELPLTIRYTIHKFYLMAGINAAYYLSLNVEQVEKEYKNVNPFTTITNATKSPILTQSVSKLKSSDFGSRIAMGWVLSAGYQITPAWQADLRIVNPFWDNAQGAGAKSISKDFYKISSVQISIGYQFGRSSRPTFGPTP